MWFIILWILLAFSGKTTAVVQTVFRYLFNQQNIFSQLFQISSGTTMVNF